MISTAWRRGIIGVALVALLAILALSALACSAGGTTTTVGGTATTGATAVTTVVAPTTTTAPALIAYSATIQGGRAAAGEIMEQTGAPSLSLALVEGERVVWVEQFGLADKDASTSPTADTMYGMASVSKTPAAIAIMKLVDQGKIDLDAPLTTYLPDFRMASPEYTRVTVRMLLDHSSGFPGTDDRNSVTSSPFLDYAGQVLVSLQDQRLKHTPGSQNEYCNDGFTVIEKVVASASGMSYAQFVQDEIFTPLGMTRSRYPLVPFPQDSFAQTYTGQQRDPQQFVNTYGSGGLYSTPSDMARLVMMFIGRGALGATRILSESAVAAMSVDQTLGTFDPVPSDAFRFGLGWDTVAEPGLKAVGVSAWAKGGDTGTFGSAIVVAPDAKLGVVVCGTNGIDSTKATMVAERILLQALVDQGTIAGVPVPLPVTSKPSRAPTPAEVAAITGVYALPNVLLRVDAASDDSLTISLWSGEAWAPLIDRLTMRADGSFLNDQYPFKEFFAVSAAGVTYLVRRDLGGAGHYQEDSLMAQKMAPVAPLSAAWQGRLSKAWLLVNERPDALVAAGTGPRFTLAAAPGLEGLITATPPAGGRYLVDPSQSSVLAKMTMVAPQAGRDVNDVVIESRDDEEWVRFGSFLYRPLETVPSLAAGSTTVTIGPEGLAEWRSIAGGKTARIVTVTSSAAWKLFDPTFAPIASGDSSGAAPLPAASGCHYLTLYGAPGAAITVAVQ